MINMIIKDKSVIKDSINNIFDKLQSKTNYISKLMEQRALNEEWTERAINHFGTTDNPHEASFILYNGQLLNFSGGISDTRQIDHSEIQQIYTENDLEEANTKYRYNGIIQLFQIHSNAIRINVAQYRAYIYINLHHNQKITQSQIQTLKYIEKFDTERHIVYDIYNNDSYIVKHGTVHSIKELLYKIPEYIQGYN